jgi:AraC-like DNA-binding protein
MNQPAQIKKYDFKPNLRYELEIQSLPHLHRQHGELFAAPHRINFFDVIWFRSGSPIYVVDFQRIEIQPNSLLFINRNQVHFYEAFNDCEGWVMLFTDVFFCQSDQATRFLNNTVLFNDLLHVPCFQIESSDAAIVELFAAIQRELAAPENDENTFQILHNLVFTLLLCAERAYRKKALVEIKQGPDLEIALLFRDLVDKHFSHARSVAFYADNLSLTEKRLQKSTAAVFGKSPKAFLDERTVLEAKRLLLHSRANTKEIAYDLGFDEPTNFTKYFRKHTGKTPIEFRQTYFPS